MQKLTDGLQKPRGEKNADKLLLRIGRLKEKSHGVSQHYTITLAQEAPEEPAPVSYTHLDVYKRQTLGIPAVGRACILGNLIGRMAAPASELATWEWLQANSALGELLDVDFASLSHMRLYRASDLLMQHRDAIESHIFGAVTNLFALQELSLIHI